MSAAVGGLVMVAGLVSYAAACRLTGENLAAVWWDEWRLRRRGLDELDAACASNPLSSGLVVTLTTIPSRLHKIAPTLKSLLRQSARPAEIRLCLPAWSVREARPYETPAWLGALRCVTVTRCEDEGPATKFLSTLRAVEPGRAVVVVDDDRVYHPRLLECYAALAAAHPGEAIGGAGWSVPEDLIDRPTTLRARLEGAVYVPVRGNQLRAVREVDILMGVHSYVVRPEFFDLAALGDFSGAPAAVRQVDDVWISAHCQALKRVHPLRMSYVDYLPWEYHGHQRATSLGRLNRADDPAERGNSIALRHLSAHWKRISRG